MVRMRILRILSLLLFVWQAIYRQIQHLSLTVDYLQDGEIRHKARQLMAIGFVEKTLVRSTFNQLRAAAPSKLLPLFVYFEQQWLGSVRLEMWNVYDVDIRTDNSCEGWHNRFNRAVDRHHPNIWRLLSTVLEEQASTNVFCTQIAGNRMFCDKCRSTVTLRKR